MRFAVLLAAAAPAALALPADGARPDSTLKPWIPDPSTGLPLQPQPQLSATCQASCYTSEVQDWGEKCKWAKVCAGCNECGVASTASNPTASTESNTQQPQPQPQPQQPAAPAPGTATTGTSTSEQGKQLSATCQASCYTSEVQDWGEKCKWVKMCAGCNECGVASTASNAAASNATESNATSAGDAANATAANAIAPNATADVGANTAAANAAAVDISSLPKVANAASKIVYWLPDDPAVIWDSNLPGKTTADLAGLGEGAICAPFGAPDCTFSRVSFPKRPDASVLAKTSGADVVIVPEQVVEWWTKLDAAGNKVVAFDAAGNLTDAELPERPATRVLFMREAYANPIPAQMQTKFDLLMGYHHFAAVVNPIFFPTSKQLLLGYEWQRGGDGDAARAAAARPIAERPGFAIFVSSHCDADSLRDAYLDALEKFIQVDRFGKCKTSVSPTPAQGPLPPEGASSLIKFIAQYKFYLAFENNIAPGYATEKLLQTGLAAGAVPVHLGLGDNETLPSLDGSGRPWYVRVTDFASPEALATHLKAVAAGQGPTYASWRDHVASGGEPFPKAPEPVRRAMAIQEWADPALDLELTGVLAARRRAVCGLCDPEYVASLKKSYPLRPVAKPLSREEAAAKLGLPPEAAVRSPQHETFASRSGNMEGGVVSRLLSLFFRSEHV